MRVISGKARGTRLVTIEGDNTRPTTDRVKESLFNLIQFDIPESVVIDFFSGSGALGIEAASRGAEKVYLVERDRRCHEAMDINVHNSGLSNVEIVKSDVLSSFSRLEQADVIIMDPPYSKDLIIPVLEGIKQHSLLSEDGIIVIEHSKKDVLDAEIAGFVMKKQRKYGITCISIYTYDM